MVTQEWRRWRRIEVQGSDEGCTARKRSNIRRRRHTTSSGKSYGSKGAGEPPEVAGASNPTRSASPIGGSLAKGARAASPRPTRTKSKASAVYWPQRAAGWRGSFYLMRRRCASACPFAGPFKRHMRASSAVAFASDHARMKRRWRPACMNARRDADAVLVVHDHDADRVDQFAVAVALCT